MPLYRVNQLNTSADWFDVEADSEEEALKICHDSSPEDKRWNFDGSSEMTQEWVEIVPNTQLPLK